MTTTICLSPCTAPSCWKWSLIPPQASCWARPPQTTPSSAAATSWIWLSCRRSGRASSSPSIPTARPGPAVEKINGSLTAPAAPKIGVAKPKVIIPVFPGTNCEYDTAHAFARAGADPEVLVIRNLTPADVTASEEKAERQHKRKTKLRRKYPVQTHHICLYGMDRPLHSETAFIKRL